MYYPTWQEVRIAEVVTMAQQFDHVHYIIMDWFMSNRLNNHDQTKLPF